MMENRVENSPVRVPPMLKKRMRKSRKKKRKLKKKKKRIGYSNPSMNKSALYMNLMSVFLILWKKNEELKSCPTVLIPPTYILVQSYPISYLYFDEERKDIFLLSEGLQLEPNRVLHHLHPKEVVEGEIRSVFIENNMKGERERCSLLTRKNLIDLLSKKNGGSKSLGTNTGRDGIIQTLIPPTGNKDRVFICKWTPNVQKVVLVQQKYNYHITKGNSMGVGKYGDRFSKEVSGFGIEAKNSILRICDNIVCHLLSTSKIRVFEMEVIFKMDSRKRLWLLRTRNVRISRESRTRNGKSRGSFPTASSSSTSTSTSSSSSQESDQYNIIKNHRGFGRKYSYGSYRKKNNSTFVCTFCTHEKPKEKNLQILHTHGRDREVCKSCYWKNSMNQPGYFFKKMERKWSGRNMLIRRTCDDEKNQSSFDSVLQQRKIHSSRVKRRRRRESFEKSTCFPKTIKHQRISKTRDGRTRLLSSTNQYKSMIYGNNRCDGIVVGTISKKFIMKRPKNNGRPKTTSGIPMRKRSGRNVRSASGYRTRKNQLLKCSRRRRWSSTRRRRKKKNQRRNLSEEEGESKLFPKKKMEVKFEEEAKPSSSTAPVVRRASLPSNFSTKKISVNIRVRKR